MYNEQKKALAQFYLKTGPTDTHTHTQIPQDEMDLEVFIAPSARREDELREENVLATWPRSCGWTTAPSRSTSRQRKDQGSRTQRRRDEVISRDEMVDHLW